MNDVGAFNYGFQVVQSESNGISRKPWNKFFSYLKIFWTKVQEIMGLIFSFFPDLKVRAINGL